MSNENWIIWQRACDAMQSEMIKEVEREWKRGAIITRPDLRGILEDAHHPIIDKNLCK